MGVNGRVQGKGSCGVRVVVAPVCAYPQSTSGLGSTEQTTDSVPAGGQEGLLGQALAYEKADWEKLPSLLAL